MNAPSISRVKSLYIPSVTDQLNNQAPLKRDSDCSNYQILKQGLHVKKRRPLSQYNDLEYKPEKKSDIVGRIEVPPLSSRYNTVFRGPEISPILVPATANSKPFEQNHIKRRSVYAKSCSNLVDTVGNNYINYPLSVEEDTKLQPLHHQSLHSLQRHKQITSSKYLLKGPPASGRESPLSAAFQRAKEKLVNNPASLTDKPHAFEAMQLSLLLIPPSKRRKLQLLLRFMCKVLDNSCLDSLDSNLSTRMLLVEKFTSCIIRNGNYCDHSSNYSIPEQIVDFLLIHNQNIFAISESLKRDVAKFKSTEGSKSLQRQPTFCRQVSQTEYSQQNKKILPSALSDLLSTILNDPNLSGKERKKKLKLFQKSYPDIYQLHFPSNVPTTTNTNRGLFHGTLKTFKTKPTGNRRGLRF